MEGSERTEWPSAQTLADLREQGKVAVSQNANYCAGTLGLIAGCLIIYSDLIKALNDLSLVFNSADQAYLKIISLCQNNSHLIIIPIVGFFCGYWLLGLVQTKFFFKMGLLGFSLAKLWRFSLRSKGTSFFLTVFYLFLFILLMAAVALFIWSIVPAILAIFNSSNVHINQMVLGIAQKLVLTAVLGLVVFLILSVIFQQFLFRLQHRVSKQESLKGRDS